MEHSVSATPSPSKNSAFSPPQTLAHQAGMWIIHVCPSTGGQLDLAVNPEDTVETLKRNISRKLKLPKEKMSLLYKERYVLTP